MNMLKLLPKSLATRWYPETVGWYRFTQVGDKPVQVSGPYESEMFAKGSTWNARLFNYSIWIEFHYEHPQSK